MGSEEFILAVVGLALTLYAVLGGADFGAGVWEFNTLMLAPEKERRLIYRAIGPVWEANHVWLIFVLVALLTAFPTALAALGRALWFPLFMALVGIVFRGVAYAFRSHMHGRDQHQAAWGAVFALASTSTPFFLGGAIGALASGKLAIDGDGAYLGNELTGWVNPLSIYSALMAVGLCSYLAATYLTREAEQIADPELTELWRRRGLATGLWMGILAGIGLALVKVEVPELWAGLKGRALPAIVLSILAGGGSLAALITKRYTWACVASAAAVAAVVWGWLLAQYPALVPPAITVDSARAPQKVMTAMAWGIAGGMVLLAPSLAWLMYLFKGKQPQDR